MLIRARWSVCSVLAVAFAAAAVGQTPSPSQKTPPAGVPSPGAILQKHYDAAERFQQQGNLPAAEGQYRLFVADGLAELALGETHLGAYSKAAPYYDEALTLEPNSPQLRLDYARAAMNAGDLDHAQTLARQLIDEEEGNAKGLSQAHEVLGRTLLRMNQDQDARKELEAAFALDGSFDNAYNLAIACLDLDDDTCADRIFSTMEATYGDTPALHMDFGRAWGESDFQPRAEEEFKKVIAEDPRFPEAHYCLAATYLEENDAAKVPMAEKELREELAVSPRDFLTYAALGKLAVNQAHYADAAKYLQRAIQLNPTNPDAYLYLGQMEYNTGQYSQAETALRQAIHFTTDPSRNRFQIQKAYYLLGRILARQGKQQEAAAEMHLAEAYMQHNFAQDKNRLSGFLKQGGGPGMGGSDSTVALKDTAPDQQTNANPAAVRQFTAFQNQIAPALADSFNNLGDIAAMRQDNATAASYFQSAAEWNPALPGLNYNWGRAAFSASHFGDAILPLSSYLKTHPDDKEIRAALGVSQFMTQDYKGCVATLQMLAPGPNGNPQVAFAYADALLKTGQTAEATSELSAIEKAHPEIAGVHLALGEAYAASSEKQKAIDELRTAVHLNPGDPQAHYELGEALLAAGSAGEAVPELESAVRLLPQNPDYHRELARAYRADGRSADADRETRTYNSLQSPAEMGQAGGPAVPPLPN